MYPNLFIHSTVEGYLHCFQFLVVMNKYLMQHFCVNIVYSPPWYKLRSRIDGLIICRFNIVKNWLSSKVAESYCITISNLWQYPLFHILYCSLCGQCFLNFALLTDRYSYFIMVLFAFPQWLVMLNIFHVLIWLTHKHFGKVFKSFDHFLIGLFYCWVMTDHDIFFSKIYDYI